MIILTAMCPPLVLKQFHCNLQKRKPICQCPQSNIVTLQQQQQQQQQQQHRFTSLTMGEFKFIARTQQDPVASSPTTKFRYFLPLHPEMMTMAFFEEAGGH